MTKEVVMTLDAPAPIGPYSQAIRSGNMLFVSGQVAIDPSTNQLIEGDIAQETEQVMKNLSAILLAAGMDFTDVVKTTIFLSDMSLFSQVNEVYGSRFKSEPPARETVAVKGLPKNVNVEISVIAAQ